MRSLLQTAFPSSQDVECTERDRAVRLLGVTRSQICSAAGGWRQPPRLYIFVEFVEVLVETSAEFLRENGSRFARCLLDAAVFANFLFVEPAADQRQCLAVVPAKRVCADSCASETREGLVTGKNGKLWDG